MCMENFMVRATEETVQRCGRAEKARFEDTHLLWVGLGGFCASHGPDAVTLSLIV